MLFLIISATLLVLSFPNFNLNYLAFIGFVPLFFAIQNKSPQKAFLIFYFCGFLFYLGVLYWLYHVTVIGLIVLCLYLALYFGVFGFLFRRFTIHHSPFTILAASVAWTILEYIQSRLFSGFGWTLLGYSQYKNLPFIQIADFSGVYGVSFLIMAVNVVVWHVLRTVSNKRQETPYENQRFRTGQARNKGNSLVSCCLLLVALVYGYGYFRLNKETPSKRSVSVSVIQGNIPQDVKWNPDAAEAILDKYSMLTRMAALDGPDLIIWPETSFPGFLVSDKKLTARVLDLVKEVKIPLLLGANTEKSLNIYNSAVLISENGEIVEKYDKLHLVPFGEFVPFSHRFPVLHNLVLGELGEFSPGKEFKIFRFTIHDSRFTTGFATLICFEDIFPELARRFVKNGAEFLIVITNDAWYGKSGAPYQHAACSVFRAIENRVPVVRCANTGYSCFIDSRGRIYDSVEKDGAQLFISGYKTSSLSL